MAKAKEWLGIVEVQSICTEALRMKSKFFIVDAYRLAFLRPVGSEYSLNDAAQA